MEGNGAHVVAEGLDVVLLGNVDVCARWLGGFGGTEGVNRPSLKDKKVRVLSRNLALSVIHPIDLASTKLPLVA